MLVSTRVVEDDARVDTAGDMVVVDTGVLDADGVMEPDDDKLGVGVGDFRTATLRAVMVALDTPASLASQE